MNNLRLQLLSLFALTELTSGQLHAPIKHQSILFRPHHKHTSTLILYPISRSSISSYHLGKERLYFKPSVLMVESPTHNVFGGELGIRTLGRLPFVGLVNRCFRPLSQLSVLNPIPPVYQPVASAIQYAGYG